MTSQFDRTNHSPDGGGRRDVLTRAGVVGLALITSGFRQDGPSPTASDSFTAARDFRSSLAAQAAYMHEIGNAMPEAAYHEEVVPGIRTFAGHLLHIATGLVNMTGALIGGASGIDGDPTGKSKGEILRTLAVAFERADRAVAHVSNHALDDSVPWQSRMLEASTITKRQVLGVTRDHLAHHRGQILVYLRLKGIEPPTYVGF